MPRIPSPLCHPCLGSTQPFYNLHSISWHRKPFSSLVLRDILAISCEIGLFKVKWLFKYDIKQKLSRFNGKRIGWKLCGCYFVTWNYALLKRKDNVISECSAYNCRLSCPDLSESIQQPRSLVARDLFLNIGLGREGELFLSYLIFQESRSSLNFRLQRDNHMFNIVI